MEDFWIQSAESSYNIIPDIVTFDYDDKTKQTKLKTVPSASLNAALFGVPKMFIPRWFQINNFMTGNFFGQQQLPWNWTYIYDNSPLIKTLEKYINFQKLSPEINSPPASRSSSSSSSSSSTTTTTTTTTAIRLIVTD